MSDIPAVTDPESLIRHSFYLAGIVLEKLDFISDLSIIPQHWHFSTFISTVPLIYHRHYFKTFAMSSRLQEKNEPWISL